MTPQNMQRQSLLIDSITFSDGNAWEAFYSWQDSGTKVAPDLEEGLNNILSCRRRASELPEVFLFSVIYLHNLVYFNGFPSLG